MAEQPYARLPLRMQQMNELISEAFERWEPIVEPLFMRNMEERDKAAVVDQIDQLLRTHRTDRDLLQQIWMLGAPDFPRGSIRKHLTVIRNIVEHSRDG